MPPTAFIISHLSEKVYEKEHFIDESGDIFFTPVLCGDERNRRSNRSSTGNKCSIEHVECIVRGETWKKKRLGRKTSGTKRPD